MTVRYIKGVVKYNLKALVTLQHPSFDPKSFKPYVELGLTGTDSEWVRNGKARLCLEPG